MQRFFYRLKQVVGYVIWIMVGLSTACGGSTAAPQPKFLLGDVFTIGMGETAVIESENLTVTFDSVIGDYRCPSQVNCAEEGQAEGVITIQQSEGEPVALEFNTNSSPDLNRQSFVFGDYVVDLQSLDPYPQEPDKPIEVETYRVTLVITKP